MAPDVPTTAYRRHHPRPGDTATRASRVTVPAATATRRCRTGALPTNATCAGGQRSHLTTHRRRRHRLTRRPHLSRRRSLRSRLRCRCRHQLLPSSHLRRRLIRPCRRLRHLHRRRLRHHRTRPWRALSSKRRPTNRAAPAIATGGPRCTTRCGCASQSAGSTAGALRTAITTGAIMHATAARAAGETDGRAGIWWAATGSSTLAVALAPVSSLRRRPHRQRCRRHRRYRRRCHQRCHRHRVGLHLRRYHHRPLHHQLRRRNAVILRPCRASSRDTIVPSHRRCYPA